MTYQKIDGLPTEPGWYFIRSDQPALPSGKGTLVIYFSLNAVGELVDDYTKCLVEDEYADSEFWGPIQTPEDWG